MFYATLKSSSETRDVLLDSFNMKKDFCCASVNRSTSPTISWFSISALVCCISSSSTKKYPQIDRCLLLTLVTWLEDSQSSHKLKINLRA